jgi:small-conductance mechanosensitive channel/CRP-like cAMP-binding protein
VNTALAWILPALFICSIALWRVARERTRIRAAWTLLLVGGTGWAVSVAFAFPDPGAIREISVAFIELAAAQVCAVAILDLLLRRIHVPKFVSEALLVATYLAVVFSLLYKLGVNVTGIFATSAVVAAAVGLALQDMLGNIAGGITLELEGAIQVGDFITSGDHEGWVRHVRFRHTAITTRDGDTVILPNSQLTRSTVRIFFRARRQVIPFHMSYYVNPREVIEAVEFALRTSPIPHVAANPAPQCAIQDTATGNIQYAAIVWLTRPGYEIVDISGVLTRVYFALHRAGMPASPITQQFELRAHQDAEHRKLSAVDVLRRTPILRLLSESDLFAISANLKHLAFAPGEHIVRQGDSGDSMFFVVSGSVGITFRSSGGIENQIAVMQTGDFFGEASLLTGEPRTASAVALTSVDCYSLDKSGFQSMVKRVPELPEDISTVLAYRQMELDVVREKADRETARRRAAENEIQLLERIRRYFSIAD